MIRRCSTSALFFALLLASPSPSMLPGRIQIADAFATTALAVTGGFLGWLSFNAQEVYNSIKRWWGGPVEWGKIWEDYKKARHAIMQKEPNDEMRHILISDMREDFRIKYPQWAYKWN
ncbi:unnamed protein product [Symbiodinium natans]|uniref:Uncharacterized protein n=1 Tax=Symbiodinium natans TaxID=878477 RepID=A0A812IXH4_9DINO|nr:unnamed protein product [Symbiodinium natans]